MNPLILAALAAWFLFKPKKAPAEAATAVETQPGARTYTVVSGDSLSKIAQRIYGDPMKWGVIYAANQGSISDPNLIYPGQVLTIPAMQ